MIGRYEKIKGINSWNDFVQIANNASQKKNEETCLFQSQRV